MSITESPEDQFALFWVHYPKKVGKLEAFQDYVRKLDEGAKPHDMLRALKRYRQFLVEQKIESKFIPHAATFLACWRDWVDPRP